MACTHLRKLYQLCQEQELSFGGTDLIRIFCKECGSEEVCPSSLTRDLAADDDPAGDNLAGGHAAGDAFSDGRAAGQTS